MVRVMLRQFLGMLLVLLLISGLVLPAFAAEMDSIKLQNTDESANAAFSVGNMFPGDSETKDYLVKVKHNKPISLYYHADIQPGFEKLAEVLMVKIELPDKDIELYDGLMRDMPSALEYELEADEKELLYRITVYLETSVGNDYQQRELKADFRWWYLEEEGGDSGDGDHDDDSWGSGSTGKKDYVNVKIIAEKYMNGKKAKGSAYSFELLDEDGDIVRSKNNKNERIEFRSLHLTSKGEYTYYLHEVKGDDAKVIYDESEYKVIIKVRRDNDGDLCAYLSYEKDGKEYEGTPRFYNKGGKNPVDTSDGQAVELYLGGLLISVTALLLVLFLLKRKKEEKNNG